MREASALCSALHPSLPGSIHLEQDDLLEARGAAQCVPLKPIPVLRPKAPGNEIVHHPTRIATGKKGVLMCLLRWARPPMSWRRMSWCNDCKRLAAAIPACLWRSRDFDPQANPVTLAIVARAQVRDDPVFQYRWRAPQDLGQGKMGDVIPHIRIHVFVHRILDGCCLVAKSSGCWIFHQKHNC